MVASRQTPGVSTSSIELFGSEGTLLTPQEGMNPPPHGTLLGARRGEGAPVPLEIPSRLEPFADERDERLMPFRLFTREFLRGVEEGSSPAPNFDDGYACQQVLDAICESSERGARVVIAPPDSSGAP
jgi:predicted dehydrogenase